MNVTHIIAAFTVLLWADVSAAADEQPICPDRPSKSTGPCTVPPGKWQVETGLFDWSRTSSGGTTTDMAVFAATGVKYGVSQNADIELWLTPLEMVRTKISRGSNESHSSVGDTLLRIKYELTSSDAPVQVALDPFLKVPTASHQLGNGRVEGGLLVPVQISLGKSPFSISLDPELDILANQQQTGHHVAMIQLLNVGWQASRKLTFTTELWRQWDWDPSGTGKQLSWDASAAYLVNKDLQLDAGANLGLNRQTPAVEIYTGVSTRF